MQRKKQSHETISGCEFSPWHSTARAVSLCRRVALARTHESIPFPRVASFLSFSGNRSVFPFRPGISRCFFEIFWIWKSIPLPPPILFSPCSPIIQHRRRWRRRRRGADSLGRERAVSISSALSSEARVNRIRRCQVSIRDLVVSLISQVWFDVVVADRFGCPARFVPPHIKNSWDFCLDLRGDLFTFWYYFVGRISSPARFLFVCARSMYWLGCNLLSLFHVHCRYAWPVAL
jgi:hypothetical protein